MAEGKNVGAGTAKVADVKIKGLPNTAIDPVDVVITLSGGVTFEVIGTTVNVSNWFTNKPAGNLTAKPKNYVAAGATSITITVSGTASQWNADALAIKIPGDYTSTGDAITVAKNDDARYDIAIIINGEPDLATFADQVNNQGNLTLSAKLASSTTSIDATGADYLPIAKNWRTAGKYAGDFDGNNGTIEIDLHGTTSYLALFAINNGTIHDLTVTGKVTLDEDETSTDADYIAGVVAYNDVDGHINHVIADVEVTAYTDGEPEIAHNIGGIAGFNGWDPFNDDSPPPQCESKMAAGRHHLPVPERWGD